jgi:hypothetical protein
MTHRSLVGKHVGPLVGWTLFVWVTRIRNIWTDEDLSTAAQLGRTLLTGTFLVFAFAAAARMWGERDGETRTATVWLVFAFAGWSIAFWLVRAVQIGFADHDVSFKVVHAVLGVVSIALSVLAVRRRG